MKYVGLYSAAAICLVIIIFAQMFRYEYIGPRAKMEIRVDRWSGCVEVMQGEKGKQEYEKYAC